MVFHNSYTITFTFTYQLSLVALWDDRSFAMDERELAYLFTYLALLLPPLLLNVRHTALSTIRCHCCPYCCPNMSRLRPLRLFSEVASRRSSSAVPSRDFHHNICSAWAVTVVGYKAHIISSTSDVCLECGVAPHSVEHLFNCQSHLTQLTVQDLWDKPAAVADFLNLDNWR